jgi:hypothetical protein
MKKLKRSEPVAGNSGGLPKAGAESPATTESVSANNAIALTTTTTTSTTTARPLTPEERGELAALENVIEKGLATSMVVANALFQIRDKELWRGEHKSFAEYCRAKWVLEKSQAYRLSDAAKVLSEDLSPLGEKAGVLPIHETQVRPLVPLTKNQRSKAWMLAVDKAAGGPITAKVVQDAVAKVTGQPIEKPKKRSPWAGLKKIAKLVEEARQLVAKIEPRNPRLQQLLDDVMVRLEKFVEKI